MDRLPIDPYLPALVAAVRERGTAVLVAPPGAGKTTRVPPALAASHEVGAEQVVVLEPRRVAARAAARRMAFESGTEVGGPIGYHIRFDRRAGPSTRILVVTEGLLTRRLQDDPFLEGVGTVVIDEFHERSLHADLALALLRELRSGARPDLRVVVMSATMDPLPVASFLGDAPVLTLPAGEHPVEVEYLDAPDGRPLASRVASGVRRALSATRADVLAFLPGAGEIAQCLRLLEPVAQEHGFLLLPLHGDLPAEEQDRALAPASGRKVVLATNVAETSLTIEGVGAVVDGGQARQLRHDPRLGLDRLELRAISRASAEQRAGRAGRTGPGRVWRLWTRARHRELEEAEQPEVCRVDLAAAVLELKAWGVPDPQSFGWFESPPPAALEGAQRLLRLLGALPPEGGVLTSLGHALRALPLHPRLGRLMVEAHRRQGLRQGALLAALCTERDILRESRALAVTGPGAAAPTGPSDLLRRLELFHEAAAAGFRPAVVERLGLEGRALRAVARAARQIEERARRSLGATTREAVTSEKDLLKMVLAAFPDRVARRRTSGSAEAVMVGGRGLRVSRQSVVRDAPFFVAVTVQEGRRGQGSTAVVHQASLIEPGWLSEIFPDLVVTRPEVLFDPVTESVVGREHWLFGDLVLEERRGQRVDPVLAGEVLARAVPEQAPRILAADRELQEFLSRLRCLRVWRPELALPALDAEEVTAALVELCAGRRSLAELRRVSLLPWIKARLEAGQLQRLELEAPDRVRLPSGRRVPLIYREGRPPVLSAKVQELFGLLQTPTVAGGRVRCLVEVLAPSGRPVQLTQDLASFWLRTYPQVRKDLRGRYPKHAWPEVPPGLA